MTNKINPTFPRTQKQNKYWPCFVLPQAPIAGQCWQELISGVTTNAILIPGFSLQFLGTAEPSASNFGHALLGTFLFGSPQLYEEWGLNVVDSYHRPLNGFNPAYSCIQRVIKILVFKGSLKVILDQPPQQEFSFATLLTCIRWGGARAGLKAKPCSGETVVNTSKTPQINKRSQDTSCWAPQ